MPSCKIDTAPNQLLSTRYLCGLIDDEVASPCRDHSRIVAPIHTVLSHACFQKCCCLRRAQIAERCALRDEGSGLCTRATFA
eukprot:scaffold1536_cov397-Prasinococcus_capsulatus_cf.AAC.16